MTTDEIIKSWGGPVYNYTPPSGVPVTVYLHGFINKPWVDDRSPIEIMRQNVGDRIKYGGWRK